MELSRGEIILLDKERSALQARAAPQDRRAGLVDPIELGSVENQDSPLRLGVIQAFDG
jgi:hypothetical protein